LGRVVRGGEAFVVMMVVALIAIGLIIYFLDLEIYW